MKHQAYLSLMTIEYRHPTIEDIEIMTDVVNRSSRELPLHRDDTAEEMRVWTFEEDDYDPAGYLLAFVDGEPAGYGGSMVQRSRQESGMNDAFIGVSVVPEHRGIGIEQHFMKFAIDYLRSRGVKYAKRWTMGTEGWRNDLSVEFGMKDIRHGYTMIYDKDERPPKVVVPEGIEFHKVMFKEASDEDVADFVQSFNDTFANHFNFSPQPVERFIKYRDTEKEISILTYARKGDKTVGVCMCEEPTIYNEQNGTKDGWANILGVSKEYRSKGLGRALLADGMNWVWDRGLCPIYLGMDAENSKALDLYISLGFRVNTEGITYKMDL